MQSTRLWERLASCKTLVVEGREAGKGFEEAMGRYYEAVRAGRGALFFAVCRGKVSGQSGGRMCYAERLITCADATMRKRTAQGVVGHYPPVAVYKNLSHHEVGPSVGG